MDNNKRVDRLVTKDQDFHQRRVKNAAPSADPNDYVIRQELDDAISGIKIPDTSSSITIVNPPGTNPAAPNALAATVTINTSLVNDVPSFSVNGTITLDTANPDYSADKEFVFSIPGFTDWSVKAPFTPDGFHKIPFGSPIFPLDVVGHSYTLTISAKNATNDITASPLTKVIVVPGYSDAANILDTSATTVTVVWEPDGHKWRRRITGILALPRLDPNFLNIVEIDPIVSGPGGKVLPVNPIFATTFGAGATVSFTTEPDYFIDPTSEVWTCTFNCLNYANKITASPTVRTITIASPVLGVPTVSEPGPRESIFGDLVTEVDFTPSISYNRGGTTGIEYVTAWDEYDWGDGRGVTRTWLGWFPITNLSTLCKLNRAHNSEVQVTLISPSTTFTIRIALGAIDKEAYPLLVTIPNSITGTFTFSGPGDPDATWVTGASLVGDGSGPPGKLLYGSSTPTWRPSSLSCTVPFTTQPALRAVRFLVREGTVDSFGVFTPRTGDTAGREFGSADRSNIAVVNGNTISFNSAWDIPWSFPPATSWTGRAGETNCFEIRIQANSVKPNATTGEDVTWITQSVAWPSGAGSVPVTGVTYHSSNCIIIPDNSAAPPDVNAATPPAVLDATITYTNLQLSSDPYFFPDIAVTPPASLALLGGLDIVFDAQLGNATFRFQGLPGYPLTAGKWHFFAQNFKQASVATTYTVLIYSLDTNLKRGPFITRTFTVAAASGPGVPPPSTVTISGGLIAEIGTRRRAADTTTHATLRLTITTPVGYGAIPVTLFYSDDNGANFLWTAWTPLNLTTSTFFDFDKVVNLANKTVVVAMIAGAINGNPNVSLPLAQLPAGYVLSSPFVFTGIQAPASNVVTGAQLIPFPTTGDPLVYATSLGGVIVWSIYGIQITLPASDPYSKTIIFTVQKVQVVSPGNFIAAPDGEGVERQFTDSNGAGVTTPGATFTYNMLDGKFWTYPPVSSPYRTFVIRLKNQNANGTNVIQNWADGLPYKLVTPSASPVASLDLTQTDPKSLGYGITKDPTTSQPRINTGNTGSSLLMDWDFENSVQGNISASGLSSGWSGAAGCFCQVDSTAYSGSKYLIMQNGGTLAQRFNCPPNTLLYFSVAARQPSPGGQITLNALFYRADGSTFATGGFITIGSASVTSSWADHVVSGFANSPVDASICAIFITTTGLFHMDAIVVRQVVDEYASGNKDTMGAAPSGSSPGGGLKSSNPQTFGVGFFQKGYSTMISDDGTASFAVQTVNTGVGFGIAANLGGANSNQLNLGVGIGISNPPSISLIVNGVPFSGTNTTTFRDGLGANRTFKAGLLCN